VQLRDLVADVGSAGISGLGRADVLRRAQGNVRWRGPRPRVVVEDVPSAASKNRGLGRSPMESTFPVGCFAV